MAIRFHCQCGKTFSLPDSAAGKKARCQQCGKVLTVPLPRGPAAGGSKARPTAPAKDDVPVARALAEHEAAMKAILSVPKSVAFLVAFESEQAARESIAKLSFLQQGPKGPVLPRHIVCTMFHKAGGVLLVLGGVIGDAEFTEIYNRMEKLGSVDEVKRWQPPREEDIPMARLIDTPTEAAAVAAKEIRIETKRNPAKFARPKAFALPSVKTVMLVSSIILAAIALDAIIFIAQKSMAGEKGEGWTHAIWLAALPIGFMMALFATQGNPFCIGVLIGGAGGSLLLRGPLTLFGAAGGFFPRWVIAVGVLEMVLGGMYLALLLNGQVRKHLRGHGATVIVGLVIGVFFGDLISPTAQPTPAMFLTRGLYTPKASPLVARWFPSLDEAASENRERLAQNYLVSMTFAFSEYNKNHFQDFPPDLSVLKKSEKFDPAQLNDIVGGKVVYLFGGVNGVTYTFPHLNDVNKDVADGLIFAYIERDPPFNSGVAVLRPPVSGIKNLFVWVPKADFDMQLTATKKWLQENPPKYGAYKDGNDAPKPEANPRTP